MHHAQKTEADEAFLTLSYILHDPLLQESKDSFGRKGA